MDFLENLPPLFLGIIMSLIVASAFIFGALLAIYVRYSSKLKRDFAAFSGGIFFATIAFSLVDKSIEQYNYLTLILGFILGAAAYSIANHFIKERSKNKVAKNNPSITPEMKKVKSRKKAISDNILIGTVIESIPKTLFVGAIVALGIEGLYAAVTALFLGNLSATLNGAKIMIEQRQSKGKILRQWTVDFVMVALAGPAGYFMVQPLSADILSVVIGLAAGTLMIFIVRELIPLAYGEEAGHAADVFTVAGFLIGFSLFYLI